MKDSFESGTASARAEHPQDHKESKSIKPVAVAIELKDAGLLATQPETSRLYKRAGKRALDVLLVLAALPITLPILLMCTVALWIEGGRPFYRQKRLGQDGKVFAILKLRTMVQNADTLLEYYLDADPEMRAEWETKQKLRNDPRITKVGKILRITSLDELPQLWNVLIGDMSLVGPRPMMLDQLSMYGEPEAYFALRPGITGKWQVSSRNESEFCTRQVMDRDYLARLSLKEDLAILRRTVGVVVRGTGC